MNYKVILTTVLLFIRVLSYSAQQVAFDAPSAGIPVIPGYFADSTIKKFGDTYYMYATNIVRLPASDWQKRGLVVNITADNFAAGGTVQYLPNAGMKSYFTGKHSALIVKEWEGKKAFRFDDSQVFRSSFALPTTLRDNAPYTLEAGVLNDSIAENECVADFTTSHNELEKIMLVSGTEPRCGVINHYG